MSELREGKCPRCRAGGCFYWLAPPEGVLHWFCPDCLEEGISRTYEQKRAEATGRPGGAATGEGLTAAAGRDTESEEDTAPPEQPSKRAADEDCEFPGQDRSTVRTRPAGDGNNRIGEQPTEHSGQTEPQPDRTYSRNAEAAESPPTEHSDNGEVRKEAPAARYSQDAPPPQTNREAMEAVGARHKDHQADAPDRVERKQQAASDEISQGAARRICPECNGMDPVYWVDSEGALCWFCPECEKKGVAYKAMP